MKSENREKNIIGITMGDPCGIGPEVILKALSSQEIGFCCGLYHNRVL